MIAPGAMDGDDSKKSSGRLRRPGESVRQSGLGLSGFVPKKDSKMSDLLGENMALYTFLTKAREIKPATLDLESKVDSCCHCKQGQLVFIVTKLHHCRLCGHMYCMRCCSMLSLPSRFLASGQDGLAHVCYHCEVQYRFLAEVEIGPYVISPKPPAPLSIDGLLITLPTWVNAALYRRCAKCLVRSRQGHNCRFCGDLFCDKCTVKQPVPTSFEKKNKLGHSRVCDRCKFLVGAGARLLIEDRSGESKQPAELAAIKHELTQQFMNKLQRAACAGCGTSFHLLNKRHQCPLCVQSWCSNCIDPHLAKEKAANSTGVGPRILGVRNGLRHYRDSLTRPHSMVGTVMNSTKVEDPQKLVLAKLAQMSEAHRKNRRGKMAEGSPGSLEGKSRRIGLTDSSSSMEPIGEADASFEVLCRLGEGSYGTVYKAVEKATENIVAIKVIEDQSDTQKIAELMEEIKFLEESANDHIVSYRGTYHFEGRTCIAMEYCCAGSLTDIMEVCDKTFEEKEIAVIMRDALMGLDFLHKNKKMHRDIKAGNILLNDLGECKLADFGVSCRMTEARRMTMIGTPYWMAPEVLQAKARNGYDEKADIWSLGITALELAKGVPPLADMHPMRVIFKIPFSNPPCLPDPECWSKDFTDFLAQSLRKESATRPSAGELLRHPFITNAGSKSVMLDVVNRVMLDMDQFRKHEVVEEQSVLDKIDHDVANLSIAEEDEASDGFSTTQFSTTQLGTTQLSSDCLSGDSYKRDIEKAQSFDVAYSSGTTMLTEEVCATDSYQAHSPQKETTETIISAPPAPPNPPLDCQCFNDVAEVQFRQCSKVKDRTYHLKSYPRCFVGRQTVDTLVATGVCPSRAAAVELGKSLMLAGVFFHVTQEHHFKDEDLFYRFTSDFALLEKNGK